MISCAILATDHFNLVKDGPALADIMNTLGRERVLERLR